MSGKQKQDLSDFYYANFPKQLSIDNEHFEKVTITTKSNAINNYLVRNLAVSVIDKACRTGIEFDFKIYTNNAKTMGIGISSKSIYFAIRKKTPPKTSISWIIYKEILLPKNLWEFKEISKSEIRYMKARML